MKKKVIAKAKRIFIIFTLICVTLGTGVHEVYADTYEPLNNLAGKDGDAVKKVSGESTVGSNNTSTLKVELRNSGDRVVAYKLSEVAWENGEYKDPEWTREVAEWLESYSESESQSVMDILSSPKLLGSASSSVWTTFYQGLLGDEELVAALQTASTAAGVPEAVYSTENVDEEVSDDAKKYYATFSGLTFGTYAVVVTNATYAPLVINIVPDRSDSGYTIRYVYETTLKEHMSSIDKKINQKDYVSVAVGDTVDFDIVFEVPTFNSDSDNLVLTDEMSKAFRFNGDESDVVIKYQDAALVDGSEGADDSSTFQLMQNDVTEAGTLYEIVKSLDSSSGHTVTYLTVTFNTKALSLWLKQADTPSELANISVSYKATVTNDAEYGSENNYNMATLDVGSSSEVLTDTVHAYTYAVNVLKLDGSSADNQADMAPLSGAEFAIYKEAYIFVNGVWKGTTVDPINGNELVSYALENEPEKTLEEMLADSTNYYVYEVVPEEDGTIAGTGEVYNADDKVSRVFEIVKLGEDADSFDGTFSSVASRDGYTVNGLNVGNYVLTETMPPHGYSALAEDLMFSIVRMTNEDAELLNNGSLSAFYEQNGTLNESGCIDVVVLNYRGLTLPSTGGRGTIIFIVIGSTMMMITIMIVLIKRGNMKYREYME